MSQTQQRSMHWCGTTTKTVPEKTESDQETKHVEGVQRKTAEMNWINILSQKK